MNQTAFDALIDRLDAEIAQGPVPPHKLSGPFTLSPEYLGSSRLSVEDEMRTELEDRVRAGTPPADRQGAFALQPSTTELIGMGAVPEVPCPPRPPEPPPTTPSPSWFARLFSRRNR